MAGEVVERQKPQKGGGLRKPKRRLSIRIDMTPMVDIAFLLLIFYMVTTIFAAPQAMEINLPPKEDPNNPEPKVKVRRSNLLTIRADKEGDYYYDIGKEINTQQDIKIPWKIPRDSIRNLMIRYNWDRPKLNTLFVIHPEARYAAMVDLLDEVEVAEALLRNNPDFISKYKAENPDAESFSYRYALQPWTSRDDETMAKIPGYRGAASTTTATGGGAGL